MGYTFALVRGKKTLRLPVPPSSVAIKTGSRNQAYGLVGGKEINVLKSPGLKEIDFDVLIPRLNYPFASYINDKASKKAIKERALQAGMRAAKKILGQKPKSEDERRIAKILDKTLGPVLESEINKLKKVHKTITASLRAEAVKNAVASVTVSQNLPKKVQDAAKKALAKASGAMNILISRDGETEWLDSSRDAKSFLVQLEKLKKNKKPFQFIISRKSPRGNKLSNTNIKVSLEEYSVTEDAGNGFDLTVSMRLKEYRAYGTKVRKIKKNSLPKGGTRENPAHTPKTYKVVKGDCLWNIAKKFLNDATRYPEIAKLNSIKNPNLIYPGQVLKLPTP
ncbi:MAG: LysM peptidoglycan-binding domain-containing protein [Oscillospiraceae bacterium]|nr:LysM peptidoglycan-binding domain-containing protein [Oscillospiraceae bacterium]